MPLSSLPRGQPKEKIKFGFYKPTKRRYDFIEADEIDKKNKQTNKEADRHPKNNNNNNNNNKKDKNETDRRLRSLGRAR